MQPIIMAYRSKSVLYSTTQLEGKQSASITVVPKLEDSVAPDNGSVTGGSHICWHSR